MSRTRHNIPDSNPTGDKCYPLFVPDDPQWKRYISRAIRTLTFDRHWERDNNDGADVQAVRDRWNTSTYLPFIDALQNDTPCEGSVNCFELDTTSEIFTFYPNDPYTNPENDNPNNQIASLLRWQRWGNADTGNPMYDELINNVTGFLGYFQNDAMLFIDPTGFFANPIGSLGSLISIFTSFPLPYIQIDVVGEGEIEIEVLNVPFGGTVVLIPDLNLSFESLWNTVVSFVDGDTPLPELWAFAETNRDLASIPPETLSSFFVKFDLVGEGNHTVHALFIPRIDDSIPFVFPFGGIRGIKFCGNLQVVGSQTQEVYDGENYKTSIENNTGFVMGSCLDIQNCVDGSQSIQDIQESIQEIEETTDKNEYPPPPTIQDEPDILCASSWYIARELESIIQQLILGTDFQNIQEFIAYWLFDGGWRYTSLSEIWNLYNTLNNPNLATEVTSAIEHVAHAFYCNELDRDLATTQIQEDTNITDDAKALYVAVIEAWTNSKFALATAIGRNQTSEDCSNFCLPVVDIVTFDTGGYPYDQNVELKVASAQFTLASGNVARKSASSGSTAIQTVVTSRYTNIYIDKLVFDAWAFMNTNDENAMELQYKIELYAGNGGSKFLDTGYIQIDDYDQTSISGQVSRQKHVIHDFGGSMFIRAIITSVRVVGSGGRGTQVDNIGVVLTP